MPSQSPATAPSPALIFDALTAFQRTAALKTAIELDLFSQIAAGATTAAALAANTGSAERGVRILCDSLTVLGLLHKIDQGYQLTSDTALFLDRRSPDYLGSMVNFLASDESMQGFAHLTAAVKKGGSITDAVLEPESDTWVSFARNMGPMQRTPAQALAALLLPKPSGRCKVLDIAAGHGMFGIAMAQRNPEAEVYFLDWPNVLEVARENAAAAGVSARAHWIPGSAFTTDFGHDFDWVLLPNFLHHFDPPTCEGLLTRVRAALGGEGEAAVLEFVVDEDRVSPPQAALFSLIMLASTPAGDAYSYSQLDRMFRRAGFSETELHPLPPTRQRVVIAAP